MKRTAFTLIELLVVVVIIAVLAALLLPAVNMARESSRRSQCVSRQRDIALAMIAYNTDHGGLPGVVNQMPIASSPPFSWVVAILPMLGENKRYEMLMANPNDPAATGPLEAVICPTAKVFGSPSPIHYVVNCGTVSTAAPAAIVTEFTLFRDRRDAGKVKLEEIPDGVSNTILLSENLDARTWGPFADTISSALAVGACGFVWSPTRDPQFTPNAGGQTSSALPRPSSKHSGVYIAAYGDGSAKPLNEETPLGIYLAAVCPDDEKAKKSVADGGLGMQ